MTSKLLLGGTLIIFLGLVGYAAVTRPSTSPAETPAALGTTASTTDTTPSNTGSNTGSNTNTGTPTTQPSGYTMAEVAQHSNATSCWAAINGNVYDLTKWINQHPGGQVQILSLCGTDGSAAFNGQHGGERRPANELSGFLLGALAS